MKKVKSQKLNRYLSYNRKEGIEKNQRYEEQPDDRDESEKENFSRNASQQ